MRLSLSAVVILVCLGALSFSQRCSAMPHVVASGGDTLLVVREMEQETHELAQDNPAEDLLVEDVVDVVEEDEVVDIEVSVDEATMTTQSPSPARCRLRQCWKGCQRRGYNWGLCLCKKCHCYY